MVDLILGACSCLIYHIMEALIMDLLILGKEFSILETDGGWMFRLALALWTQSMGQTHGNHIGMSNQSLVWYVSMQNLVSMCVSASYLGNQ